MQREESQDLSIDTQVSVIHSPEGFQPSPNFQKQRNRMRFTTRIGYESMSYQATVVAMEMKTIEDNRKIVRADTVDLDFALTFTRVRGSRSGHFSLLFGLYSPFSWGDAAKFTVTPRAHAGLGLGLALELVKFEGQFRYHHPLVEKNSSTIDSVKVTFQPGTYWHSKAQLRITAFPLAEPFLDAGAYYLRSSQYDTTMTTRKIPAAELYYLRYGVDISTPLDILSVQLAVTRPIEQPDIVSYVMTTGRRTPEALMKEYSLGLNVRI